jgi:hypothetical protein
MLSYSACMRKRYQLEYILYSALCINRKIILTHSVFSYDKISLCVKGKRRMVKVTNQNENNTLPPKTCTIDRLVTLEEDVKKVIAGQKTATRRNGRYADVGEIMNLQGHQYIVENVYSQALGELTDENARQEGYKNVEEYKQSILSIHPGMPWLPQMRVWVHEFRPIRD